MSDIEPFVAEAKPAASPADEAPAIVVTGLSKRYEIYSRPHHRLLQTMLRGKRTFYREFWAVRDVTLAVRRGETLGVIGRNGSGKSTLLQLVAGTLTPTTGTVSTHGRVAALLELGSGFNPEFTGRENVYLNGAILGILREEMTQAFGAIEEFAGIGDFIEQPVKTYSSGMMVRLAFAVAVHVTPDILIIDEALAVGDTPFQSKCLDRIRRMQRDGVAVLLVSHSLNTVIEFCDRAAYLDRGNLVAIGPCREVVERYSSDMTSSEARIAKQIVVEQPSPAITRDMAEESPPSEIVEVTVTDASGSPSSCFAYGDEIRITVTIAFHQANPAPCFGIQIKSTDDIALWASSTASMNLQIAPAGAGERHRFTWRLRANLGGSRFVIALGAGDNASGTYLRHSRVYYAGHFDVLPEPRSGAGWLNPQATFEDGRAAATQDADARRSSSRVSR